MTQEKTIIPRCKSVQSDEIPELSIDLLQDITRKYQNKSDLSLYQNDLEIDIIEDESDLEIFELLNGGEESEKCFHYDGNENVVNEQMISPFDFRNHNECLFSK